MLFNSAVILGMALFMVLITKNDVKYAMNIAVKPQERERDPEMAALFIICSLYVLTKRKAGLSKNLFALTGQHSRSFPHVTIDPARLETVML